MGVAGHDEAKVARGEAVEQAAPRRRGDVADVDLGVVRAIAEERLVEHHAERTPAAAQLLLEPRELRFLLRGPGAEELCVERYELPRSGFDDHRSGPTATVVAPSCQIERMLIGSARRDGIVSDVVIPGTNRMSRASPAKIARAAASSCGS